MFFGLTESCPSPLSAYAIFITGNPPSPDAGGQYLHWFLLFSLPTAGLSELLSLFPP